MSETSTSDILLFVNSSEADYKVINRFLLDASTPDAGPGADYTWHVALQRNPTFFADEPETTQPGSDGLDGIDFDNPWAGASISEIEAFAFQAQICVRSGLILILDDKGVEDEIVIVAERAVVYEDGEGTVEERQRVLDEFKKVRVPRLDVVNVAMNLWVANMGFEEFTTSFSEGTFRGGWYEYRAESMSRETKRAEKRREREPLFKQLQEQGLV
ncbi:hypothetical protein BU23DRAFT_8040 [Bimuria novae-zelandiae CBS 107.79]|uniref:DUF6924 domain-containing protein n=1 Tax=Bimuria novae-zelandiae CBS 107.79 TaxID=1447943 RepID=A0A6A5VV02_9PLEO|nr:hypothetical protein BU23DRAFT_8040 [Bimuria novae-zelandiae CBS 107.79]